MITAATRSLERPEPACLDCWRVWLVTAARDSIGYCRHHEIAWRVRPSGELVTAPGTNRKRHLAMVKALEQRRSQLGLVLEVGVVREPTAEEIAKRLAKSYRQIEDSAPNPQSCAASAPIA